MKRNKKQQTKKSLKGIFSKYADSEKQALEDRAWENHIITNFTKVSPSSTPLLASQKGC